MNFYPNPDGPVNHTGSDVSIERQTITTITAANRQGERENCQSFKSTLAYITITSVKISKEEKIKLRRDKVLELRAQGLTQQEIANKLSAFGVSRRTVGNDLEYLSKNALSIVRAHQRNIAFEYQQVLSNFYQLRKDAWTRFNDPKTNNHDRMTLYHILENLNHDILDTLAVGDMIEYEALESMKKDVSNMQKAMHEMELNNENGSGKSEQAIF
ncbi:MAG: hypothetical protein ACM3X1_09635 [Ignavibacteriales bacterium]